MSSAKMFPAGDINHVGRFRTQRYRFLPALGILPRWLRVFNNTDRFKNRVTQIENEEAEHEWDCVISVDESIGNHYPGIEKKFYDNGQKIGVDKFYIPFLRGEQQVIKRQQRC